MLLSHFTAALLAGLIHASPDQTPLMLADELGNTVHVTHDAHPHHSLSITPHRSGSANIQDEGNRVAEVCPGATDGYTGYLNKGDKQYVLLKLGVQYPIYPDCILYSPQFGHGLLTPRSFYFAYFQSRSSPKDDPVVMWINGGPGCSSMMGLMMELGPCSIDEGGKTAHENKDSWINAANIFFLDQPIGVGFSYSDNPDDHANGTFAASEDVYIFMELWYQLFPEARKLPFSIAGESYGGHYIPIFASHINEMNKIAQPEARIPLESVLIGNGIFADTVQASSAYDISCTNATGIGPLLKDEECAEMANAVPRCEYLLKACEEYPDPLICNGAVDFCSTELENPYFRSGLNYYDVSKPCNGPLCYPIMKSITTFLRLDRVRKAFGVNPETPEFEACSNKVGSDFRAVNDGLIDTRPFVTSLLHSGVRVMIYVGTYDWVSDN